MRKRVKKAGEITRVYGIQGVEAGWKEISTLLSRKNKRRMISF